MPRLRRLLNRVRPSGDPPGGPARGGGRGVGALVVPALVGALVALVVVAATGNLGGRERIVTIVRDPTPLPISAERGAVAEGVEADGRPVAEAAKSVQRIVREATPAVVKVTSSSGTDEEGGPAVGSGFLVDRRGRVLTNAHVLEEDGGATVTFDDGTESEATVLGRDESTDLAVLSVGEVPAHARPLPLGRSAGLAVGDPVVAIGNPFGLERTATTGIVSAVKRTIEAPDGFTIQNVIQTDAAINRGNSGGPLLDRRGRVIGINSQIATGSGGSDGVGFAVPIDTIRPVADSILSSGKAQHAWVGVLGTAITPAVARALGMPGVRGVAVIEVDERGPAEAAGLRPATTPRDAEVPRGGDLIVGVNGAAVEDMADVSQAVASRRVGQSLTLEVLRDGARRTLNLTLADRPADVGHDQP
jgi:S1-C subfamily serine protease